MQPKTVVIAPDSFKESLTALEVAEAIEEGFREIHSTWDYQKIPMADGGEGTLQSLIDATGGEMKTTKAKNPLNDEITAQYGLIHEGKQAVIEMATASGLELIASNERDAMAATSWGLGDLIKAALDDGVEEILIGIGGSATNDAGAGMLQSLGGKLLDENGEQIPLGGAGLSELATIDLSEMDERLEAVKFEVASDVNNPLTGENGASYIYGEQKGATSEQIEQLEQNIKHFADLIEKSLDKDIREIPGAGAAGGLGAALIAFLDAELRKGGDVIVEMLALEEKIEKADLVITGEGGINNQTIYGKTPIVVAEVAKKFDLPVIAIAGSLSDDYEEVYENGLEAVFSVLPKVVELETALEEAYDNVKSTARNIAATLKIAKKL
jgi:glycerate kinase